MRVLMNRKGFSLVELVIVMAVIALILSIAIPNFRAMQREGEYTKAEGDLDTLKVAVTSYWRHNSKAYPANIHTGLTGATPSVITKTMPDPWNTDSTNVTYGYAKGNDSTFGDWFYVYTKGPNADTTPSFNATNQRVEYTGSGRVISNAPILKN